MTNEKPIRLAFTGDLCVGMEYLPFAESRKQDLLDVFGPVEPLLREADLGFINLEGPLDRGPELKSGVSLHLSNDPAALEFCKRNRIQAVCIANNHMLDHGRGSLAKTLELLNQAGLSAVGARVRAEDALKPVGVECRGKTFGFLGFTAFPDDRDRPRIESLAADRDGDAVILHHATEAVLEAVRAAKKAFDYVLVSLHWGYEFYRYPSGGQYRLAHDLVEAGCDFVLGHHPHVIQGIERYKSGLIFYSLGNFFLPLLRTTSGRLKYEKPITREFAIFLVEADSDRKFQWRVRGGQRGMDYRMNLYEGKAKDRFERNLREWSAPFEQGDYERFWKDYEAKRTRELEREEFLEAFKKIRNFTLKELIQTLSPGDFTRNWQRLKRILFKTG